VVQKWIGKIRNFRKNLTLFTGVVVLCCAAGSVQAESRFQPVAGSNGAILRDNSTGLEWQRCPHGQTWTDSVCSGAAWRGSWYDASTLTAPGGFRVPTIEELRSLAPYDLKVFPSEGWFWSASSISSDSGFAWNFFFINGLAGQGSKKRIGHARLVRVGQ